MFAVASSVLSWSLSELYHFSWPPWSLLLVHYSIVFPMAKLAALGFLLSLSLPLPFRSISGYVFSQFLISSSTPPHTFLLLNLSVHACVCAPVCSDILPMI